MSNAFAALIWWVVPALGLIGALGYVTWVSKFEGKYQQETQRSVGQFQRFQDSLRESQARDFAAENPVEDPGVEDTDVFDVTSEIEPNTTAPLKKSSRTAVIRPDAN